MKNYTSLISKVMNRAFSRALLIATFGTFVRITFATDYPPQDHGGADLIIATGDRIWGNHTNLRRFEVPAGSGVQVLPLDEQVPGSGWVRIQARTITVLGDVNGNGAGYPGGAGGIGRDSRTSVTEAQRGKAGQGPAGGLPDLDLAMANDASDGIDYDERDHPGGNGGYAAPAANADETTDTSVWPGSGGAGGNGSFSYGVQFEEIPTTAAEGGRGGGSVQLIASRSLLLGNHARILAQGQNGQLAWGGFILRRQGSSASGGGAGGGVLIEADHGCRALIRPHCQIDARGGSNTDVLNNPPPQNTNGGTVKIVLRHHPAAKFLNNIQSGRLLVSKPPRE